MSLKLVAFAAAWILFCSTAALAADDYVHTFTGFSFPIKVADFARTKVTPLNAENSDIEVDYDNNPRTAHVSVYVYPASEMQLHEHYLAWCAEVSKANPTAKLLQETPLTLRKSGVDYHGYSASFSLRAKLVGDKAQDLLSKLLLFRRGAYDILYRISYVQSDKDAAEKQIDTFLDKLAWPAGGTDGPAGTD